jgi:hypothetical protein
MSKIGKAWSEAIQKFKPYVVFIETPHSAGTGFFIGAKESGIVGVATAYHVISKAVKWREGLIISQPASSWRIFINKYEVYQYEKKDSALLRFQLDELNLPGLPLEPLPIIEVKKRLKEAVEIGWCGYPGIVKPPTLCFFHGRVSAWLPEHEAYVVDGIAINGVSGAPAFTVTEDDKPKIVGMVTAYIPNVTLEGPLPGLSWVFSINHYLRLFEKLSGQTVQPGEEEVPF